MDKQVTIIAAMGRNRAIGLGGRMPWHLPGELQHFKRTTLGKPIVMGRRTWDSLGRPLPGRQNIVVSRSPAFVAAGAETARSLEQALDLAQGPEVMIIGGGQLYRLALPLATRMVLTLVDCTPEADTWFPAWDPAAWRQSLLERGAPDERDPLAWEVVELARISVSDH